MAMIAAWPDILNCSGKQHDPFEKCCLQGASSFVHVLTFHCGKTCLAGLAYTCAECVQWSGSCWNPIEDGATANSGGGRQERPLFLFLRFPASPAVSKPQQTREEQILETEFGCFTLPNFIGSRCLPPFFGETTCADGRCLPVSLSLRAVLCFGLCKVFFELFWAL